MDESYFGGKRIPEQRGKRSIQESVRFRVAQTEWESLYSGGVQRVQSRFACGDPEESYL